MSPYRSAPPRPSPITIVRIATTSVLDLASGLLWGALLSATLIAACVPPDLSKAMSSGMRLAALAEGKLVRAYYLEQEECLRKPSKEQDECIQRVRSEWRELRQAYSHMWESICELEPDFCEKEQEQ